MIFHYILNLKANKQCKFLLSHPAQGLKLDKRLVRKGSNALRKQKKQGKE